MMNNVNVATTSPHDNNPTVVSREKLKSMHTAYTYQLSIATGRKERLEKLMGRKCAQKWPAHKKAKMVKRFIQSNKEFQELHEAVDFIEHKLTNS